MRSIRRFSLAALAAASLAIAPARDAAAAVVSLAPSHDNTLFDQALNRSCGDGPLFAGQTNHFGSRRAVIAFDVSGAIPPGATITSVALGMTVEGAGPPSLSTDIFRLHRLLADWGEENSSCADGVGALAEPGDATWSSRHFDTDPWTTPGGDFEADASGSTPMPVLGPVTWSSQPGMVADVQSWLDAPAGNFGWIILGDESAPATAREFDSRESLTPPSLSVEFTAAPATPPAVPDGQSGSPLLLSKLSQDGADLGVSWDTASCTGHPDHHLVFGRGSGFPAALPGPYVLAGSECQLGGVSSFVWNGSPNPALIDPGKQLMWILVLADDGAGTEGSWGRSSQGERDGTGAGGSSNQCGIGDKSLSNTCGTGF